MNPPTDANATEATTPTFQYIGGFYTELNTAPVLEGELQLIWTAPQHRPFSEYNFKKELYAEATTRHREFYKHIPEGIYPEHYQEKLQLFKKAFKEWAYQGFHTGKWATIFYRDETKICFNRTEHIHNDYTGYNFQVLPTTDKYSSSEYKTPYEFRIESKEEITARATEYIEENIGYFNTHSLANCLKENVFKPANTVDYKDLCEDHKTDKDYNETECSCCFNELKDDPILEGGFLAKCGHCVCVSCLKTMVKSMPQLSCPICRDNWECYQHPEVAENEEYEEDDIEELKENPDWGWDILLDIVDIPEFIDHTVDYYGWDDILGEGNGFNIPGDNTHYYSVGDWGIPDPTDIFIA